MGFGVIESVLWEDLEHYGGEKEDLFLSPGSTQSTGRSASKEGQ